jgi:hypothetical protein
MLLLALTATTLVSCDDDSDIAATLEGTWKGNMEVSTEYQGQSYQVISSEICFVQDPYSYSSGTGYWIDYYQRSPWRNNQVANHIQWTVSNGVINVYFVEERTSLEIRNYSLYDGYFRGTIYYGDQVANFRLRQVSSPNWNSYTDWGYDYDDDYYYDGYAKKNVIGTRAQADSTAKPVRHFGKVE